MAPDYNPDKEAHRNHKWIVHKALNKDGFNGVRAGGKVLPFDSQGRFAVSDESVAKEIRNRYPRSATVTRVTADHASDRGHKYFFTCPEMPWHKNAPPPRHDFDSSDIDDPQG